MNIANKLLRKFTRESGPDKNTYDFNLNTINKSVVVGISSTGKMACEKTHKYPTINPVVFVGKSEKITEEICRMKKMEYAEAVLKKITESWINEEAFISIDEVIKNL